MSSSFIKSIGISLVLLSSPAIAGSGGKAGFFVGLWEGVDPNDGGRRTISISNIDEDSNFEVVTRDTFWSLCGGDRGVARGVGVLEDGVLRVNGTLTCFEDPAEVPFETAYEPERKPDSLVERGALPLSPVLYRVNN